ncbi:MAG TPA: hypothetical protein VD971_11975 [Phycisphaerales bacterium]|nr:hypothetical protein [Phycisphaerales bacterium]
MNKYTDGRRFFRMSMNQVEQAQKDSQAHTAAFVVLLVCMAVAGLTAGEAAAGGVFVIGSLIWVGVAKLRGKVV